jgi:hypothetical protein
MTVGKNSFRFPSSGSAVLQVLHCQF